ncbi:MULTISPECIES: DUF2793 domain-containing protein [Pseudomonas]|uniref:DUF2793 domain-containing protein n=1 Tax=Pseudomonas TaxID=286 RepID=UPI00300109B4
MTTKLGLTDLVNGQANYLNANQTFALLNQLVQGAVVDKDLAAPPGSPADESLYIIAASATGAWAGQSGKLAFWLTSVGAWTFVTPREGMWFHVNDEDAFYKYTGSAWEVFSGGGGGMTNPMTTAADIIVGGASGVPARLAAGSALQVLRVNAAATALEYADPASGSSGVAIEDNGTLIASASTINFVGATVADAGGGKVNVTVSGGGMTNPMTTAGDLIVGGAAGAPTRLAKGTDGQILTMVSGAEAWASPSGGGLTYFSESKSTTFPNGTIPAIAISVSAPESNIDLVLNPKGSGSILSCVPDGATSGGDKRGTLSVDLQISRASSNQVASGINSVISGGKSNRSSGAGAAIGGGYTNFASGLQSFIGGGDSNKAEATQSAVLGGGSNTASGILSCVLGGTACVASGNYSSALGGGTNTASGDYSIALGGFYTTTRGLYGVEARANGRFSVLGDAQRSRVILRCATTNATPVVASADGSSASASNQLVMPNNSAYSFSGRIVARSSATGDCASYRIDGTIRRGASAASTEMVSTVTPIVVSADSGASGWSISATADTTRGGLAITVTGAASTSIKWVADIETVEVVG